MPITAFIAPKFKGATPNDLTDTQKTLINYCNQMSEEMELALLEQAKTYARVSRRVREEKHREEMEALRPQIEADKRKAREIVRRKT
jgi:FAD synthase